MTEPSQTTSLLTELESAYRQRLFSLTGNFFANGKRLRSLVRVMRLLRKEIGISTDGLWLHEVRNGK